MLAILKKFREVDDPPLRTYEGACLSTLSKKELFDIASKNEISIEEISHIGGIELTTENTCKLLHFGLEEKDSRKVQVLDDTPGPSQAKRKKSEEPKNKMQTLEEKLEALEKQLKEKEKTDEQTEFERAKRAAREEASKAGQVNVDLLHEKLVILDSVARKANHDQREKISMVLSRFHAHKTKPSFAAAFVLKLLSTKEEESVLEKEQKLMKRFGLDLENKEAASGNNSAGASAHMATFSPWGVTPLGFPYHHSAPQFSPARYPSWNHSMSPRMATYSRPRGRAPAQGRQECFKCRKTGHLVRDCPLN